MQDFRKIEVWRMSRPLVVAVYRATQRFPPDERFGLTQQVRRSVTAIGANISEAFGRHTRKDVARILSIAKGEGNETLHHLITALDLGYLTQDEFDALCACLEPVRQKLHNLRLAIKPVRRRRRSQRLRD